MGTKNSKNDTRLIALTFVALILIEGVGPMETVYHENRQINFTSGCSTFGLNLPVTQGPTPALIAVIEGCVSPFLV